MFGSRYYYPNLRLCSLTWSTLARHIFRRLRICSNWNIDIFLRLMISENRINNHIYIHTMVFVQRTEYRLFLNKILTVCAWKLEFYSAFRDHSKCFFTGHYLMMQQTNAFHWANWHGMTYNAGTYTYHDTLWPGKTYITGIYIYLGAIWPGMTYSTETYSTKTYTYTGLDLGRPIVLASIFNLVQYDL